MKTIPIVVLCLMFLCCAYGEDDSPYSVTLNVTGTASDVSIYAYGQNKQIIYIDASTIPYSYSFETTQTNILFVSNKKQNNIEIHSEIIVDGEIVRSGQCTTDAIIDDCEIYLSYQLK